MLRPPGSTRTVTHIPYTTRCRSIPGAPGAGKSTLTSALVGEVRGDGEAVAVLAIDPSSAFSGGAILGDRVRMQDHTGDPGVFIRSMATRGHLGGLALSTLEAIRALDAACWPWVVVETVGVGQVAVDVGGARAGEHTAERTSPMRTAYAVLRLEPKPC